MLPTWEHGSDLTCRQVLRSQNGSIENLMVFLGQTEVAVFLRRHPAEAERLQAWLSEMRHRDWDNAQALSADFRNVDTSSPPRAIFQLGDPPLRIETLIDFRTKVVLVLGIDQPGLRAPSVQTPHFSSMQ